MPGKFSEASIQRVKEACDIVGVVESYLPLKRAGSRYKALCPFHDEKTPSFTVNPELQLYKCFGCGEGGDAVRFVMRMDGLSFPEAIESLAERSGVPLEREAGYDPEAARERSDAKRALYRINALALSYFESSLETAPGASEAREYLLGRGFTPQTLSAWRLGWAPEGYDGFQRFLERECGAKAPLALQSALAAGLVRENERGPYDFFRGRVVFPILDVQHRPIGFGARLLKEDPEKRQGKYVNSPESPLFKKSGVLFGLDAAAREIRLARTAVIVEGYTDVIMCHQHGLRNVVATLGTALTREHVRLLRRYADEVIARFDADEAGSKATDAAIRIFVEEDMPLRIVRSEEIKDACEFLPREGADAFRAELDAAEDAFSYFLRRSFDLADSASVDEKAESARSKLRRRK